MSSTLNSGMLRIARQLHGFSQGEAAQRVGVPQSILSRYENEMAQPPEDFISRAALVYDFPVSFFNQPDQVFGPPVSVHPMWRKKQDVTVRDVDRIVAELNVRILHIRRLLNAVEFSPQSTVPKLDPDEYEGDIERIASTVRAHWMVPSGPLPNLTALVEKAGCIVVRSNLSGTSVSGVTISVPGVPPIIVLNDTQPSDRKRFTLAHELGHIVMHRFPNPNMEQEANRFASALLMPEHEIRVAFAGRVDLSRLAALKPEWKVSMQALLYRAKSLGIIDAGQNTYLWKQFSIHGIRIQEPPSLDFSPEVPGVLTRMIRLHLDNFGYSKTDLARLLHIHEGQIGNYYDLKAEPEKPVTGLRLKIVK